MGGIDGENIFFPAQQFMKKQRPRQKTGPPFCVVSQGIALLFKQIPLWLVLPQYRALHRDRDLVRAVRGIVNDLLVMTTENGGQYPLRHVINIWRGTELGFSLDDTVCAGLAGQTVNTIDIRLAHIQIKAGQLHLIVSLVSSNLYGRKRSPPLGVVPHLDFKDSMAHFISKIKRQNSFCIFRKVAFC